MPLLDHFHAPVELLYPFESFHSSWATRIADALNELLPPQFIAVEQTHAGGRLEFDVATFETKDDRPTRTNGATATTTVPKVWAPPAPPVTIAATFPDSFEVRVFSTSGGWTLVGTIELVSPGNKDRSEERQAFVTKCAGYLHQGVSLIMVDIVTNRRANLHNELLDLLEAEQGRFPAGVHLYAAACRPVRRQDRPEIDIWPETCAVGTPLPTLPLRLTGDLFVPVELEASYHETCRRRRLI
jgi:hypothetical protein